MTPDQSIGQRVRHFRRLQSQREIGRQMRVHGQQWTHLTVASVERGERPIRLSEAIVLSRLLGTSLGALGGLADDQSTRDHDELNQLRLAVREIQEALHAIDPA